jgi:peptidyl-prolyl cis-trans isomerase D
MSIIQTIRDKGSWVIFTLLALALIAFIFMDAGKQGSLFGGGGGNKSIGSVNGSSLKNETYGARTEALRKIYGDNQRVTEEQINGYIWNSMVNEKLMKDELNKIGFSMSDKELVDFIFGKYGQPNQHIVPFFTHYFPGSEIVNPQTGQLNQQMADQVYRQYIRGGRSDNEMATVFNTIKGMARAEFLMMKHSQVMANTVYVPLWMAKKQMADNNSMANISYVQVPYTDISDSIPEMKVSDDDIVKFMEKRKYMYQQDENRVMDYTMFDFTPTGKDSLTIFQTMVTKKEELRNTKDSLAGNYVTNNNSLTPYQDKYFRKKELTIKGDSSGYNQGAVFGPYIDQQGNYSIAKITAVKTLPDTVSARHILIQTYDPRQQKITREESEAKSLMDSVIALYRKGISFDSLARKYSDDGGSKDSGGLYKSIGLNQMVPEFNEFVFTKNIGDTGVVKTDFGYHFIQVTGRKGGSSIAYKVAYLSKLIEASQVTRDSVYGESAKFAAACRTAASFDDYFVKNPNKLKKLTSAEIRKDAEGAEGFRKARDLIRWVYKAKLGEVSEPLTFENEKKIVVAKLANIYAEGLQDAKKARMGVESLIRNERKYDMLVKKYATGNSLEEMATKTGKQVMTRDSVSFESGSIPNVSTEPRVAGAMLNPAYQAKMSGPIKGVSGVFYIKVNGQPYARPAAVSDPAITRKQLSDQMKQGAAGAEQAYRRGAKIKDKRLDAGY